MASQVLSGANNASYTNNTGQNVRLIINYMTNVTSMTWSSSSGGNVTVTASAATIGKDVPVITTTNSTGTINTSGTTGRLSGGVNVGSDGSFYGIRGRTSPDPNPAAGGYIQLNSQTSNIDLTTTTTTSGSTNFPTELMLANGHSFSAVCGAYNAIVIKEDGT